ncbi:MAG: hypothetical protein Q7T33_02640 [Dehalococcoidia bacterium]|nr:hypothetical protein [Dehalococcoidia bacterium]
MLDMLRAIHGPAKKKLPRPPVVGGGGKPLRLTARVFDAIFDAKPRRRK